MSTLLRAIAVAVVVIAATTLVPASGIAAQPVWVATFAGGPPTAQHPATIGFSGDGNVVLTHIKWHGWGKTTTTASAKMILVESCIPDCASAKRNVFAVRVEATRIKPCRGRRTYTSVTAYFLESYPEGERSKSAPSPSCSR